MSGPINPYPVLAGAYPVPPRDAVPGVGPTLPIVKTFNTAGTVDLLTAGIPLGATLTITMVGAGGGGGNGGMIPQKWGGGGGSGAAVVLVLEPAVWNLGAVVVVPNATQGGQNAGDPGFNGADCVLTLDAGEVTAGGGDGGGGSTQTAGAGGTVSSTGTGFTVLARLPGNPGTAGVENVNGVGGLSVALNRGKGGNGHSNTPDPGLGGGLAVQFAVGA